MVRNITKGHRDGQEVLVRVHSGVLSPPHHAVVHFLTHHNSQSSTSTSNFPSSSRKPTSHSALQPEFTVKQGSCNFDGSPAERKKTSTPPRTHVQNIKQRVSSVASVPSSRGSLTALTLPDPASTFPRGVGLACNPHLIFSPATASSRSSKTLGPDDLRRNQLG